MESLHPTLLTADTTAQQQDSKIDFSEQNKALEMFKGSLFRHSFSNDRTQSSPRAHNGLPSHPDKSKNIQNPEDCSLNTLTTDTKYGVSKVEQWSTKSAPSNPFNSPPLLMDIASLRHKIYHKPAALIVDALLPPSLSAGSSSSGVDPPTPMSPREREMTLVKRETLRSTASLNEGSMNFVFNSETGSFTTMEWDQNLALLPKTPQAQVVMHLSSNNWPTMEFSEKQWSFEVPDKPLFITAHETFPLELRMPQPSYLRATKPLKAFEFSHATSVDFLDECKPRLHNTNNASEYRGEQPQPIKTGLSPVITVFDEGRSANNTTKVEEVKIKIEIDYDPEVSHQDQDVSEDDSCASDKPELFSSSYMKAFNAILKSALDKQEDKQDDIILPILDPMRQALVERIMDEFYLIFNQDWAARITQCPEGCSSTSGDGKGRGTPVDKVSLPTSQRKRQRSHDEDSADESGNKKSRRQHGGPRPPSELNNLARFACPFRKHNPQKYNIYSHRVCALTSWDTIARVK
jgi:hypothetical protein